MFLRLFLIQKEASGRVPVSKKVFPSLWKAAVSVFGVPETICSVVHVRDTTGSAQAHRQVPDAGLHWPDPFYPLRAENFPLI